MISVITCSIDDRRFAALQDNYHSVLQPAEHEIIRISDARSLAEGYNRGIEQARGEILVFSHDDIEILAPVGQILQQRFASFDLIGVAGTTRLTAAQWSYSGPPYLYGQIAHVMPDGKYDVGVWSAPAKVVGRMEALDGVFIASTRRAAESLRFDSQTFDGFHCYDIDFTFRAHLMGLKLAVCCDIPLIHASYGKYDQQWLAAAERFGTKFDAQLPVPAAPLDWQHSRVIVTSKADVLRIMRPPHWADD